MDKFRVGIELNGIKPFEGNSYPLIYVYKKNRTKVKLPVYLQNADIVRDLPSR